MKRFATLSASVLLLPMLACLALVAGCKKQTLDQAAVAEYRTNFTLADEPDGAQSVLEVREILTGEPMHDHADEHAEHADDEEAGHEHADEESGQSAVGSGQEHDEHEEHGDHDEHEHEDGDAHQEHGHDEHVEHDHVAHDPANGEEIDVILVGAVGGVANPWEEMQPDFPFAKDEAVLYLVDAAELAEIEGHGHQHAPGEECAFCAAHAGDTSQLLARVEFKDKNGKLLAVDSRRLFDLKEKEMVVVCGKARMAVGGQLVVDATGLFVRR